MDNEICNSPLSFQLIIFVSVRRALIRDNARATPY